jgi:hypothetical protein
VPFGVPWFSMIENAVNLLLKVSEAFAVLSKPLSGILMSFVQRSLRVHEGKIEEKREISIYPWTSETRVESDMECLECEPTQLHEAI